MISDTAMEANDKRNSEIMDLEVPIKLGDGCPFLIKYYGALHAEVINSLNHSKFFFDFYLNFYFKSHIFGY